MSAKNRSREGGLHHQRREAEIRAALRNDPTLPERIAARRAYDEKFDNWGRPRIPTSSEES